MYYGNTSNNFDPKTLSTKKGPLTPEERAALIKYIQEKSGGGSSSGGSSSGSKAVGTVGSTLATAGGKYAANKAWDYYSGSSALPDNTSIDTSGQFQYTSPDAGGGYQLQSQSPGSTKLGSSQPAQAQPAGKTPTTTAGTNYGQAGLGALQAYQGVNQYRQGNYTGGTINTAAGIGNVAASGALGSSAASGASSALGGYLVPGLNLAAGLYGGYQTAKYTGSAPAGGKRNTMSAASGAAAGAATGAAVGTYVVPVIGTAIGGIVGGLVGGAAGAIGSWTGSSKDQYQMLRDQGRKHLKKYGILDDKYQGTLADGTKFDFGKDGKGQTEIDYNDPVTGEVIAKANVLAAGEGWTGKAREGMAKLYTAAALSNSNGDLNKAYSNMAHFMKQRGYNLQDVQAEIQKQYDNKKMTEDRYKTFMATASDFIPKFVGTPAIAAALGSPGMRPGKTFNRSTGKYTDNKRANGRR